MSIKIMLHYAGEEFELIRGRVYEFSSNHSTTWSKGILTDFEISYSGINYFYLGAN